jgi:hypothetical protein
MKTFKNVLLVTLPTILIAFIILEVFFRVVIPASDPPGGFFDENEKLYCLGSSQEEGLYTVGKFAEIRAKWRVNDTRWNYPIDYHAGNREKQLIAVIGDSFIEALQVDVDHNYPFLLRHSLEDDYEVYAFGVSGAPLSQYLHMSRYVNKHFNPDIVVFNLVHNDFAESISSLSPHYYYFLQVSIDDSGVITETTPRPNYSFAQYKPLKRLCYQSALFRYLYFNLKVNEMRRNIRTPKDKKYEANIDIEDTNRHKELIFQSTEYLVNAIRAENEDKRIVFVINAPRDVVYDNASSDSQVLWIHEMLDTLCTRSGIELVDLIPLMSEDYRSNEKRFDSELDAHWNEYGHQFVSKVLYKQLMNNNL